MYRNLLWHAQEILQEICSGVSACRFPSISRWNFLAWECHLRVFGLQLFLLASADLQESLLLPNSGSRLPPTSREQNWYKHKVPPEPGTVRGTVPHSSANCSWVAQEQFLEILYTSWIPLAFSRFSDWYKEFRRTVLSLGKPHFLSGFSGGMKNFRNSSGNCSALWNVGVWVSSENWGRKFRNFMFIPDFVSLISAKAATALQQRPQIAGFANFQKNVKSAF